MYDDRTFDLGQIVQDRISGFTGVVNTVGFHIGGCERIGLLHLGDTNNPPKNVSSEEFFYPTQLQLVEADTEWTDTEPMTDVNCEVGERVRDRSTMFDGHVHIVNFKLFNCPQVLAYEKAGDLEAHWIDAPLVEPLGDTVQVAVGPSEQSTGAADVDARRETLSSS
jgi:hypothetical protein